jgi:hypothetical protein
MRIEELVVDIKDLDVRGELVGLSTQEVEDRKEKFALLWKCLRSKEALLFQRSRSMWLKQGDANTKFFHGSVKARLKLNQIVAIRGEENWLESPSLIKEAAFAYFESHVSSTFRVRPKLGGVDFPRLSGKTRI